MSFSLLFMRKFTCLEHCARHLTLLRIIVQSVWNMTIFSLQFWNRFYLETRWMSLQCTRHVWPCIDVVLCYIMLICYVATHCVMLDLSVHPRGFLFIESLLVVVLPLACCKTIAMVRCTQITAEFGNSMRTFMYFALRWFHTVWQTWLILHVHADCVQINFSNQWLLHNA